MITKKAEYAVIMLAELAVHPAGTVLTSKEIAGKRDISVNLVVQLMALLKDAGWISGTRGPAGGIKLTADPADITIKDVIEKVDGPLGITRCLFSSKPCGDKKQCSLRGVWLKAQRSMLDVLDDTSIKDLAEAAINDS